MASLKHMEREVLGYFNEETGPDVDEFWARVRAAKMPYARRDVLGGVFDRGRIRTREEYDLAVDVLVGGEQEGRITATQSDLLKDMIGVYTNRGATRKRGSSRH